MKDSVLAFPLFFKIILALGLSFSSITYSQQEDLNSIYYEKIDNPRNGKDLLDGLEYYSNSFDEKLIKKDTLGSIYALRMMSIANYELGNYYDAENNCIKVLTLIDTNSKQETLLENKVGVYNQLGRIYTDLINYDRALEAYNNALAFATKISDSLTIINNKGNIYKRQHDYINSKKQYSLAFEKMPPTLPESSKAMILDNLGFVKAKLQEPDGLQLMEQAKILRLKNENIDGLYSSYKNFAMYYLENNDLVSARVNAALALETATKINSPSYKKDALSLLIDVQGDSISQEFRTLTDSLAREKQREENKNAALKYDYHKQKQLADASALQREKEKRLKIIYQWAAVLIFLLGIFFFYILRSRQRQKEQQQVYLTETRISKKVHDEVANEVYGVMTRIEYEKAEGKELLDSLEHIYHKTRDISKESNLIDYENNFEEVIQDLVLTYQNDLVNIITKNEQAIDWDDIPSRKKIVLYRVLQELLTNMKKHSKASVVALSFQQKGKKLMVDYADNGNGSTLHKMGGLHNAENRIHSIGGKIKFETEVSKGFKAQIQL